MRARVAVVLSVLILVLGSLSGGASAQKPSDALDSVDAEWAGVQTDLLEVKRMSDNTVRVRWRWRNTGAKSVHLFSSDEGRNALKLFFFQAEDGIRDLIVTGVQTCALPIWFGTCWQSSCSRMKMPRAVGDVSTGPAFAARNDA